MSHRVVKIAVDIDYHKKYNLNEWNQYEWDMFHVSPSQVGKRPQSPFSLHFPSMLPREMNPLLHEYLTILPYSKLMSLIKARPFGGSSGGVHSETKIFIRGQNQSVSDNVIYSSIFDLIKFASIKQYSICSLTWANSSTL